MSRFKVTQTYNHGMQKGIEGRPGVDRFFDTLEEAGKFITDEKAWDVANVEGCADYVTYRLYETVPATYVERKYTLGITIIE